MVRKAREHLNLKSYALAEVKQRFTQNANNEKTENIIIFGASKS